VGRANVLISEGTLSNPASGVGGIHRAGITSSELSRFNNQRKGEEITGRRKRQSSGRLPKTVRGMIFPSPCDVRKTTNKHNRSGGVLHTKPDLRKISSNRFNGPGRSQRPHQFRVSRAAERPDLGPAAKNSRKRFRAGKGRKSSPRADGGGGARKHRSGKKTPKGHVQQRDFGLLHKDLKGQGNRTMTKRL